MAVFTYEWCRVEGGIIPDLGKEYGTFTQLPSGTRVFYGTPEVQIYNPTSVVNGCSYKVVPISEFGYSTILDIDKNYSDMLEQLSNYDKTINFEDDANSAQYYYEPFALTESSIVFHADSTKTTFDHYAIVLVDPQATPDIITIVATYKGSAIPVGDTFDINDIDVFAVYSDGNRAKIIDSYTIDPEDHIITQLKSNNITITYTSPKDVTFTATVIIEGVRRLEAIEGYYDGPTVGMGTEALKKYFVVVAKYSDGSSATVTKFTFPDGNIVSETNSGVITIYYNGLYTTVVVPTYSITSSRLMAYYNGPSVEVGHNFDIAYSNIRIYYSGEDTINTYYESVDPELCTFSTTTIDHEGANHILVQYNGEIGTVSTTMIVIGISPKVVVNFIEATYTGPAIVQGKAFSIERVICKAHYSNGAIVTVRNFTITNNIVELVGPNEFLATYKEDDVTVTTTFTVVGIEKETTTESNYNPIYLQNHYPEMTRLNNRYRGPAEGYKHDSVHKMIYENITELYKLFADIEVSFNQAVETIYGNNNLKARTLNTISQMQYQSSTWMSDSRFTTGKYQETEETNE